MATRTPDEALAIAAAYLASPQYREAWAKLETSLESWSWGVWGYDTSYMTARFGCGPYPANFEHRIDLGISRERFNEGQLWWCSLELVNHVILGLPWLTWWSDHQTGPDPFGYNSPRNKFRETLATAIHDEARPKVKALPAFQQGMDELFRLTASDEIAAECRDQITQVAQSNLAAGVTGLRVAGWSEEDIRTALEDTLTE